MVFRKAILKTGSTIGIRADLPASKLFERGDSMDLMKKWSKRVKRMKKIKKAIKSIRKNSKKIASSMETIYKAVRNKPKK